VNKERSLKNAKNSSDVPEFLKKNLRNEKFLRLVLKDDKFGGFVLLMTYFDRINLEK
jgi:hypothetical protein